MAQYSRAITRVAYLFEYVKPGFSGCFRLDALQYLRAASPLGERERGSGPWPPCGQGPRGRPTRQGAPRRSRQEGSPKKAPGIAHRSKAALARPSKPRRGGSATKTHRAGAKNCSATERGRTNARLGGSARCRRRHSRRPRPKTGRPNDQGRPVSAGGGGFTDKAAPPNGAAVATADGAEGCREMVARRARRHLAASQGRQMPKRTAHRRAKKAARPDGNEGTGREISADFFAAASRKIPLAATGWPRAYCYCASNRSRRWRPTRQPNSEEQPGPGDESREDRPEARTPARRAVCQPPGGTPNSSRK